MYKVISLQLFKHPILKDVKVDFTDFNDYNSPRYVSLIIGANGTGKTQIIKTLIEILIFLNDKKIDKNIKWANSYNFKLSVLQDKNLFNFESFNGQFKLNNDQDFEINFLPKKILVSAYTFDDKYPKIKQSGFYNYLGLKTTTNNIFLRNPSKITFESFRKIILSKDNQLELLDEILKELRFKKRIKVIYEKRSNYKLLLNKQFIEIINEIKNSTNELNIKEEHIHKAKEIISKVTGINDINRRKRIQDDAINRVLESNDNMNSFLSYLAHSHNLTSKQIPIKFEYSYNWEANNTDFDSNDEFIYHSSNYNLLSDLDILSFENFLVFREDFFDFRNASSGEFHFLHLVSNIISNIEDNSLVVIDEPEISLHANWQNKFFYLINPIIERFKNCHFIIASHSHFLVSEMDQSISAVITLKKDSDHQLKINNLEEKGINPYGWSAEQILFNVFEVATDRNYYLSNLVETIIREMSAIEPNYNRIDNYKKELDNYDYSNLNNNDPMKKIIKNILVK